MSSMKGRKGKRRTTHCHFGHPLTSDNVRVNTDGYKQCLVCWAELVEERRSRKLQPERFAEAQDLLRTNSVVTSKGCWEWQGQRIPQNYGTTRAFLQRSTLTHRLSYEVFKGPIPTGLHIDHLCVNPPCCNPEHLEPVTRGENVRRGWERGSRKPRTHCRRGHEFTPENTRIKLDGRKRCRECSKKQDREAKRRIHGYVGRIGVTK